MPTANPIEKTSGRPFIGPRRGDPTVKADQLPSGSHHPTRQPSSGGSHVVRRTERSATASSRHLEVPGHAPARSSSSRHPSSSSRSANHGEMVPYAGSKHSHVVNSTSRAATSSHASSSRTAKPGDMVPYAGTKPSSSHAGSSHSAKPGDMVPYAGTKRSSSQNDRGSHFDSRTVGGQVQGLSRRTEGRTEGRTRKDGTITQVVAQGNLHDQDIVALAQRVDQLELEKKDAKKPRESRTQHEIDRLEDKVDDLERRDCVREVLARVGWYGPPRRVYRE